MNTMVIYIVPTLRYIRIFLLLFSVFILCGQAQDFPLTIEHKFGSTVIERQPQRIATLDFAGADDLLAMGVQPVAIRYWQGDYPKVVWPWAAPLLTSEPVVIRNPIDYELLASARPDVIIALWSGINQQDYDQLSKIAPVVAVPEGIGDYSMHWDERARMAGKAIGKEDKANELIADINAKFAAVAAAHPEWQGKTATVAYSWYGTLGGYSADDARMRTIMALGFVQAPAMRALATAGNFRIDLSGEMIEKLDADLLLWVSHGDYAAIKGLKGRQFLNAYRQGHEIILDKEMTGAFSHGSLLSLPFVIDKLVPQIEAVLQQEQSE